MNISTFNTLRMPIGRPPPQSLMAADSFSQVNAQRDPFAKAELHEAEEYGPVGTGKSGKPGPAVPVNYGPPAIEARIEYFKRLRETPPRMAHRCQR